MTTFLIIWLSLGLIAATLTYGMSLAYWWHNWPILQSKKYALYCVISSIFYAAYTAAIPLCLLLYWLLTDRAKHGLLFRNPAKYL